MVDLSLVVSLFVVFGLPKNSASVARLSFFFCPIFNYFFLRSSRFLPLFLTYHIDYSLSREFKPTLDLYQILSSSPTSCPGCRFLILPFNAHFFCCWESIHATFLGPF